MRVCISAILAIALTASSALADDGALAPGKPAGVKKAQAMDRTLIIELGMAAAAAGIALALSSGSHNTATVTAPVPVSTGTSP
jgi:hypothetical protein